MIPSMLQMRHSLSNKPIKWSFQLGKVATTENTVKQFKDESKINLNVWIKATMWCCCKFTVTDKPVTWTEKTPPVNLRFLTVYHSTRNNKENYNRCLITCKKRARLYRAGGCRCWMQMVIWEEIILLLSPPPPHVLCGTCPCHTVFRISLNI